jgi:hypothetical protein
VRALRVSTCILTSPKYVFVFLSQNLMIESRSVKESGLLSFFEPRNSVISARICQFGEGDCIKSQLLCTHHPWCCWWWQTGQGLPLWSIRSILFREPSGPTKNVRGVRAIGCDIEVRFCVTHPFLDSSANVASAHLLVTSLKFPKGLLCIIG